MLTLQLASSPGETRAAVLIDGIAQEYYIHRAAQPDDFGAVHWARVVARVPAMAGAFVALAGADGFLPDTEGAASAHVGDHLAVRITRAAQGHKGPRVAVVAGETAPGPVRLLRAGPTPIEELRAAYPAAPVIEAAFPDALEAELADATVMLPGGLVAIITPTPALTAIDLDTASATGAAIGGKSATQFALNRAAIPELARQIRLRNLSGAVLIDFAGLPTRKRAALGPALTAALAADRLCPRLAGFSPLGFAEILRRRRRPPLHERLAGPHAAGLAALRRIQTESGHTPGHRFSLHAAPAVAAALQADALALVALDHQMAYPLTLHSDPTLRPGDTRIEHTHG